jgi:K+-transporting ATPase ATPase A chain
MRWLEYVVFLVIVVGLAAPVGRYLARVCQRRRTYLDPVLRPVESWLYRLLGVDSAQEMSPGLYIACFLLFGAACHGAVSDLDASAMASRRTGG